MSYALDSRQGQAVGAKIHMEGNVLGFTVSVDETVTVRTPPWRKEWEVRGEPRLLVIGPYRMGFAISRWNRLSKLRVFIDYDLPRPRLGRALGLVLAPRYARWCVECIASDAAEHFRCLEPLFWRPPSGPRPERSSRPVGCGSRWANGS